MALKKRELQAAGDLAAAEKQYRAAILSDVRFAQAYLPLGNLLWERGQREEAFRSYRTANPRSPGGRVQLTLVRHRLGAGQWRAHSAVLTPVSKTHDLVEMGEFVGAYWPTQRSSDGSQDGAGFAQRRVPRVGMAIRLDPSDAAAHFELAGSLHEAGDLPGAEQSYRRALDLHPDASRRSHARGGAVFVSVREECPRNRTL